MRNYERLPEHVKVIANEYFGAYWDDEAYRFGGALMGLMPDESEPPRDPVADMASVPKRFASIMLSLSEDLRADVAHEYRCLLVSSQPHPQKEQPA